MAFSDCINESIAGLSPFKQYVRSFFLLKTNKPPVEFFRFFPQYAHFHFYAGIFQNFHPPSRNLRIRIRAADYNPFDLFRHYQVGARRCFPVVRTWLQVDIQRSFRQQMLLSDRCNGLRLGMMTAKAMMITFADNPVVIYNHSAYHGVGRNATASELCEVQASCHVFLIFRNHDNKITEYLITFVEKKLFFLTLFGIFYFVYHFNELSGAIFVLIVNWIKCNQ